LVECKRLQSIGQLEKNIRDARRQIRNKVRDPRRARCRGIIALDLTKVENPQFGYLLTPTDVHARYIVERRVSEFIDEHSYRFMLVEDTPVLAFLLRLSVVAECQNSNTLMYCHQWGLASLPDLPSADQQIYDAIEAKLGAVKPGSMLDR
jgi:hypothetical protein